MITTWSLENFHRFTESVVCCVQMRWSGLASWAVEGLVWWSRYPQIKCIRVTLIVLTQKSFSDFLWVINMFIWWLTCQSGQHLNYVDSTPSAAHEFLDIVSREHSSMLIALPRDLAARTAPESHIWLWSFYPHMVYFTAWSLNRETWVVSHRLIF